MTLSLQTQHRLADFFTAIFEGERQAEIMRQVLVEQKDFSAFGLFNHIATGRDLIGIKEIMSFMEVHRVQTTDADIDLMMCNEEFTYNCFLNIILPSLQSSLKNIKTSKKGPTDITPQVEVIFCKILTHEISLAKHLESVREDLVQRWDFTEDATYNLLESFSGKNNKKIDHLALKRFFQSLSLCVTEDDILYLLRRADKDKDSKLGKADITFLFQIKPNRKVSSKLNTQRTASKAQLRNPATASKAVLPKPTLSSPLKSSRKLGKLYPRKSQEYGFRRITHLSTQSPIKRTRIKVDTTPEITKRTVSQFEPTTSTSTKHQQEDRTKSPKIPPKRIPCEGLDVSQRDHLNTSKSDPRMQKSIDQGLIDEDTQQLVGLFIRYLENHQIVDQTRCQIVALADFNLQNVMQLFKGESGLITSQSFETTLNEQLDFDYSINETKVLFQLFDLDRDGVLSPEEFIAIFEPTSEYYANLMKSNRGNQVQPETLQTIKRLFDQMIVMQQTYLEDKQHFFEHKRYSLLSLYEHLNVSKSGAICDENLYDLFSKFNYPVTESEVSQVILKFTKDKNIRLITMRQFLNELTHNH